MRTFLTLALLALVACSSTYRPSQSPRAGTYSTQQPAYGGNADLNGWTDPAGNGTATQGPAQPGVTNSQPPPP